MKLRSINRTRFCLAAVCLAGLFLWSCDAPHDNPLDPKSDYYTGLPAPDHDFFGQVRSLHTARNFPTTDTYSVIAEARTNESIGIDSVTVTYNSKAPVELDSLGIGLWGTFFESGYFGGGTELVGVLGQPFVFRFAVSGDTTYALDPIYMFRVIEETPVLASPMSHDTVGAFPLLVWQEFSVPYSFQYQASVWYSGQEYQAERWTSEILPDSELEIQVGDSLVDGNYFWVLYVYDEHSNSSRSREGEFVVSYGASQ